ncbi:hypothetical protein BC835DRAFT_1420256 [Cytidiella melzeri]|nr:hypothetical protein BC835DRAFT_1420256 [Cytidiella melzeri]
MPVADILHRGFLYTLVGISAWGIFSMGTVHMDTLRRGRGAGEHHALALQETDNSHDREQAEREVALAEAASHALSAKRS